MKKVQNWVIWGLDSNNKVTFNTKVCKAPSRTNEYKGLKKQFSEGTVNKYGYMAYSEYEKQNYWLDSSTQYILP